MGLFDDVTRLIKDSVGDNRDNNHDDVMTIKRKLHDLGLYDISRQPEPHGYITADMDTAIKRFQGVKGLKVDGYLLPDGETEQEMKKIKTPARDVSKWGRYLDGSGEVLRYEPEDMDASRTYRAAMDDNKKRFEDSMVIGEVGGQKHPFKDQILRLRDGESIILKNTKAPGGAEYWDQDIGPAEGIGHLDSDQAFGVGRVKFRSTGSLKATRKGDKVLVDGLVDHRFKDVYDFNPDDPTLADLDGIGHSKPFGIYGSKLEKLNGEISLEHGNIKDHYFKWNTFNEKDVR